MKRLLELSGKALQDPSFPPASSRPMKKSKQQKAALEKEAAAAAAAAAGVDDPNQILMNLSKFGARGGRQGAASAYGGYPAGLVPSQLHHPGMLAFPYSQAYAPQAYAPAGYIPMAAAQPYVQTTPGLLGMIPQTGAYVDPSMLTAGTHVPKSPEHPWRMHTCAHLCICMLTFPQLAGFHLHTYAYIHPPRRSLVRLHGRRRRSRGPQPESLRPGPACRLRA